MTEANALVRALEDSDITFERLYRIELERAVGAPVACAPEASSLSARRFFAAGQRPAPQVRPASWVVVAMFYDLHDRTLPQILDEIEGVLEDETGLWRITVYYWSGIIRTPTPGRHMGNGENFLYSYNPRGDIVLKLEPPIEIDLGEEEE